MDHLCWFWYTLKFENSWSRALIIYLLLAYFWEEWSLIQLIFPIVQKVNAEKHCLLCLHDTESTVILWYTPKFQQWLLPRALYHRVREIKQFLPCSQTAFPFIPSLLIDLFLLQKNILSFCLLLPMIYSFSGPCCILWSWETKRLMLSLNISRGWASFQQGNKQTNKQCLL